MTDITIGHHTARYELPAKRSADHSRLDDWLTADPEQILHNSLEWAIADSGIGPNEYICLRHLGVRVDAPGGATVAGIGQLWSVTLAERLRDAISRGGTNMIRYRTIESVLVELAVAAGGGPTERRWAWAQLGLWQPGDGTGPAGFTRALVRDLQHRPGPAPRVLAACLTTHPAVIHRLSVTDVWAIATAVLHHWGAGSAVIDQFGELTSSDFLTTPASKRVSSAGQLAQAVTRHLDRSQPETSRNILAWSLLALADCEPAQLHAPTTILRSEVISLAQILLRPPAAPSHDKHRSQPLLRPTESPSGSRPDTPAPSDWSAPSTTPVPAPTASLLAARQRSGPNGGGQLHPHEPPPANSSPQIDEPPSTEVGAFTNWGGLLYLLNLVDETVLDTLTGLSLPLPAALTTLGSRLIQCATADPALIAFSGRRLSDEDPDWPPIDLIDLTVVEGVAAQFTRRVDEALDRRDGITHLCRRPARVTVDPGWIEVAFSFSEIDIAVRRNALDVDPGWLSWLGAVVRFRYG